MKKLAVFCIVLSILDAGGQTRSGVQQLVASESHNEISSMALSSPPQGVISAAERTPEQSQIFECVGNISTEQCSQEMQRLRVLLKEYGASRLGQWKWVLVSSQAWQMWLKTRGVSPDIPASTSIEQRVTFLDDVLIAGSPARLSQLMDAWHLGRDELLDLAVRHELGHAVCQAESEIIADQTAHVLDRRKSPECKGSEKLRSGSKQKK